ncbi:hypothetical protein BRYFOR_09613 [Marvinbryantia formatexigens DSM 14469]|uniref:Uncharacterized protein n=1 Tax=Marvinbryantia formatexigens DSM 14469 TaxID=478749 RepID=C6LLR5_9FIRM|nr:DUF6612 family protein [Marvinbryantia formatexigens]EET58456.1 hypothetical protein BRYFOR_09613 [Marvinbryantia formatexigens DSM 14469]UWO24648.1 hypothetical protein NQ534_19915 [Marvinbryantia formatexigens DSM 14469]SDF17364.1 hypothetical protein SAMN05660368_00255 [Marvinbryantia formatexigens]
MKKKLLATVLAFSVCSVPFGAYAEDASADVTAESLMEAEQEAVANVSSMSLGMSMNMDAAMEISSDGAAASSLGIAMTGDFDVKTILDPMQMEMTGTYNVSVMGQTIAMDMDMYMLVSEDGSTVDTYAKAVVGGDDSGWEHQQTSLTEILDTFGVSSLDDLKTLDMQDVLPDGVELDWDVTENSDSYTLSTALMFSQFMPLVEASLESAGESMDSIVEALMDSLGMNLSYTLDKESSLPVTMHMDFNNSDLSIFDGLITSIMAESMTTDGETDSSDMQCRLILNDLSIDAAYTYDDVTEITVPADALATEITDPSEELQDVLDEAIEDSSEAASEDAAEDTAEAESETEA